MHISAYFGLLGLRAWFARDLQGRALPLGCLGLEQGLEDRGYSILDVSHETAWVCVDHDEEDFLVRACDDGAPRQPRAERLPWDVQAGYKRGTLTTSLQMSPLLACHGDRGANHTIYSA